MKVYLAKSNRANPDVIMTARNILSRFNVEVVEHKGGAYSHKPLLECDLLIVIPELSDDNYENEEYVAVGKGLFEQIQAFKRNGSYNKSDTLIVNYYHEASKSLGLGSLKDMEPTDPDDYVNYAELLFDSSENLGNLEQVLENRLGFKKSSKQISRSSSRYKLLLIASK